MLGDGSDLEFDWDFFGVSFLCRCVDDEVKAAVAQFFLAEQLALVGDVIDP